MEDASRQIEKLLEKYADERGRVSCVKAMAVARRAGVEPMFVGKVASSAGFRISDCELAQFGSKDIGEFDKETYEALKVFADENGKITCRNAWVVAKKFGLKKVRSTIKNSDLDVVYCQLGCFRRKKRPRLKVKTKVWVENRGIGMVFGKGKLEVLQLIDRYGSISAVAKHLGVSYKKVWNHIQIFENNMNKKYVITSKGRNSGGSELTKEAHELIDKFKQLQNEVEEFANRRFVELFYEDRKYRKVKNEKGWCFAGFHALFCFEFAFGVC